MLAVILLAGAMLRLTGVDWDSGHHLHPDERFLTMVEGAIRPGLVVPTGRDGPVVIEPASLLTSYFDTERSGLNPQNVGFGFFVYGTAPLFAVRWIAEVLNATGYDRVHLLGRVLSALADLITVGLIYLIGRRLYGVRVGLLAAALLALCVLHIQQAHFFVFDTYLVMLIVACFACCVGIAESGRWQSFGLAGLFLGLALATKLSMVVFAPIVALAGLIYLGRGLLRQDDGGDVPRAGLEAPGSEYTGRSRLTAGAVALWDSGQVVQVIAWGLLAVMVAIIVFRVFQPYAFAGPSLFDVRLSPRWLDNIAYQAQAQDGTVDLPPSIQWAGTEPLLFPWRHMVVWGMGIPLGVAAWAGFAAAGASLFWRWRWQHLLVVSWSGLCFVYFASVLNKTMRYLLPAYPFLILLGAWGLVALYDWARARRLEAARHTADGGAPHESLIAGLIGWAVRWGPPGAVALTAFVVLASALWSFAFTRIYTRPVTRVAAAEWIYQNLPRGSVLANEHWDDPLPLPLPGYDASFYRGPQLPMYDPDEPKKVETLVQMLSQSDYINLTSNRLYGSIPRMPQRYPMSTEYYRRLFAGDLGFRLVHSEESYPTLGPWVINDDRAEEAFTVYDHPKVLIFQKQPGFSPERVRLLLGAVPLDDVVQVPPVQAGWSRLLMPESLRLANTAGGTWSEEFALDGVANRLAPLLWWLVLELLGLLAAPLAWLAFPRLPDRGYGLSKALGLLAVAWLAWSLASMRLLPWTRPTLALAILALAVVSAVALRRYGGAWRTWMRRERRLILIAEGLFLGAFLLFLLIRAANPDLWHPTRGGEKPMEFSYLNAVVKTTYFPPYDPWFAGGYLNYYYFGYVLVAALAKLTGVMPSIAFNVAVPAFYGLTAGACFSFAYNLVRLGGRIAPSGLPPADTPREAARSQAAPAGEWGERTAIGAGLAGFCFVALIGNLDGFGQLLERLATAGQVGGRAAIPGVAGLISLVAGVPAVLFGGRPLEAFDFWRSSRVIPNNTINEFPFWTFLFADLHPHLMSIPYQVVSLGALLQLAHSGLPAGGLPAGGRMGRDAPFVPPPEGHAWGGTALRWLWTIVGWRRVGEILLLAWLVGALYVINSWEFPTYLLLTAATLLIAEITAQRGLTVVGVTRAGVSAVTVYLLARPFFRPFWSAYETFYSAVAPWTADKSRLDHYLIIHGLFVFALVTLALLAGGPAWRASGWVRYLLARWRWLGSWRRFDSLQAAFALRRRRPALGYVLVLVAAGVLVSGLLARGLTLVAFLTALLALTAAAAWERRASPAFLLAGLLTATGLALGVFVEFFALQGDIGRMNTVFKFYLQVWVMWALVSAAGLAWALDLLFGPSPRVRWRGVRPPRATRVATLPAERLLEVRPIAERLRPVLDDIPATTGYGDGDAVEWQTLPERTPRQPSPGVLGTDAPRADAPRAASPSVRDAAPLAESPLSWWQRAWLAGAGALVLAVLAFPLGGTLARLADRFNPLPLTLDGMAYMPYATVSDGSSEVTALHPAGVTLRIGADYEAIKWLLTNVRGSPVVLEASVPEYRWGGRVAKYTGLPAVLGWRWHQVQQRSTYAPLVDQRLRDVQTMFTDPALDRVVPLLERYDVRYVFVGDLERAYYPADGLAKFDQLTGVFRKVYGENGVTIYEVIRTRQS